MSSWMDAALTMGNPMYPQLSAPGGPLQDMNGWQKAMLGIGMLGSLFSNMGNTSVVGRRKGIGGVLASISPALAATQQQAMQAAGQGGRPAAQGSPRAPAEPNRTRTWMEANAEGLGLSPDDVAGMEPAEMAQQFWHARRARGVRPDRSGRRPGSILPVPQPDHGNRVARVFRVPPGSRFPWPDFDEGFFVRPRPPFRGGLLAEPPLLPRPDAVPPYPWPDIDEGFRPSPPFRGRLLPEPPLLPPDVEPRQPWPEPVPVPPGWRWWPPYDDPDHLIPHLPEGWRPDYPVPLPEFPRRWSGLLEVPLADAEV